MGGGGQEVGVVRGQEEGVLGGHGVEVEGWWGSGVVRVRGSMGWGSRCGGVWGLGVGFLGAI